MNNIYNEFNITKGLPNPSGQIILIDCMDTILYRDITLEAVLSLWAKRMGKEFGVYNKFLYNYRCEVVSSKMHNMVPIDDIYGEIYDHCHHFGLIKQCSPNVFISSAHSMELEIELKHQYVIPQTVEFLERSKDLGAQIYCVSDFRLSKTDLIRFFSQKGISHLFTDVFSSCDIGKTKKHGSIYEHVLNSIHKDPSDCIMIGDNLKSDCINASKAGIKPHLLERVKRPYTSIIKDLLIRFL